MTEQDSRLVTRTIHLHNELGRRQLREVLSSLLSALMLAPERIWLVSPWVSDFDLLDNRAGDWSVLQPAWGLRVVRFSEMLMECVEAGCELNLVTKHDERNGAFLSRLAQCISVRERYRSVFSSDVHVKGLLAETWYFSGSMNFTFSGANRNEEQVNLTSDPSIVSDARFEFDRLYGPDVP